MDGSGIGDFLVLVLKLIQRPINAAQREQFLVRSALAQLALVHDENPVGALDGGEAMRNDQGSAAFHQPRQRLAHAKLGFRVNARRGLVQNQEARVVGQRAGETDELFLAGGKAVAALAHRLREPFGKLTHELEQVDLPGGLLHRFFFDPLRSEADIRVDGAGEKIRILQDDSKVPPQIIEREFANGDAANADRAALDVVEAEQETGEGGLARSGVAHDGDRLAGINAETDVTQDPVFVLVCEPDVLELDGQRALWKRAGIGRRGDARRGIEQTEDAFARRHRRLKDVVFFAEVLDGTEEAQPVLKKGNQHAEGNRAGADAKTAIREQ